jgi:uncharacterized membrane protein (UPF0127 family)
MGERIRVAETGLTRIVGLLGESGLSAGDGLLILPSSGVHTWGMTFPIDVVILDNDWRIIAVRPEMRPFRMTKLYWKAAGVLELPPGTVAGTSTSVGDELAFSRIEGERRQ